MKNRSTFLIAFVCLLLFSSCERFFPKSEKAKPDSTAISTRLGKLEFVRGRPTEKTERKLDNEREYQKGMEVYIWAEPVLHSLTYKELLERYVSVQDSIPRMVVFENRSTHDHLSIPPDFESAYGWYLVDLARTGPLVVDVPPGVLGGMVSLWQDEIIHFRPNERERGKASYVILPKDYKDDPPDNFFPVPSSANYIFIFSRTLISRRSNELAFADDRQVMTVLPISLAGLGYANPVIRARLPEKKPDPPLDHTCFTRLSAAINDGIIRIESIEKLEQLQDLGIELGKRFLPDPYQKAVLKEAAELGDAMIRTAAFGRRAVATRTGQRIVLFVEPGQKADTLEVIDQSTHILSRMARNSRYVFYAHPGSVSLVNFRDRNNQPLEGQKIYRMRLSDHLPRKNAWSVAVYENLVSSLVNARNEQGSLKNSSPLLRNPDGTLDLFFGPSTSIEGGQNRINTMPGRPFLVMFQLYAEPEVFSNNLWRPNEVVEVAKEISMK